MLKSIITGFLAFSAFAPGDSSGMCVCVCWRFAPRQQDMAAVRLLTEQLAT